MCIFHATAYWSKLSSFLIDAWFLFYSSMVLCVQTAFILICFLEMFAANILWIPGSYWGANRLQLCCYLVNPIMSEGRCGLGILFSSSFGSNLICLVYSSRYRQISNTDAMFLSHRVTKATKVLVVRWLLKFVSKLAVICSLFMSGAHKPEELFHLHSCF